MCYTVINDATRSYVRDIYITHKLLLPTRKISLECLKFFSLSTIDKTFQTHLVAWKCPSTHWMKLNADGDSKGNPGDYVAKVIFVTTTVSLLFLLLLFWAQTLRYILRHKLTCCVWTFQKNWYFI